MAHPSQPSSHSYPHRIFAVVRRWRVRNRAIHELRRMPAWRLADLGLTRAQIPAFVDAMLEHQRDSVAPAEVQTTLTQWMPGPWADA